MGFDGFTVRAMTHELKNKTVGCRVEKVLQPSKDEIYLLLHGDNGKLKLAVNGGASLPRIGITKQNPENPKVPPMFCMLMRKHLTGARISGVSQPGFERVIVIDFESYDEMGYGTGRKLITEIMGRYSNIVLCRDDLTIISILRPVDFTTSSKRQMLPGMKYEMPPAQGKKNPFDETECEFKSKLMDTPGPYEKTLLNSYSGFSPLTAGEIVRRAEKKYGQCNPETLYKEFSLFVKDAKNNDYHPVVIMSSNGKVMDFSPFHISSTAEFCVTVQVDGISEASDRFYSERESLERERQLTGATEKVIRNIENRLVRKLELQKKELAATSGKDDYKRRADLITANIYLFKGRERKIKVKEYIAENDGGYSERETEIELEKGLSASQNAQKLYKKYTKAKNAEKEISRQIVLGEEELRYIISISDALSRVKERSELDEIMTELEMSGYVHNKEDETRSRKKKSAQNPKTAVSAPMRLMTSSGMEILVGKNNLQNDCLTFRTAGKDDYWFHVKNVPGSHTVLVCRGKEPSETDLTEAASVAAYYSKMCDSDKVQVDYTKIRNVKKPSGARPGYVIYDRYNTANVRPWPGRSEKSEEQK